MQHGFSEENRVMTDRAAPETQTVSEVHSDNCVSWHGPPNECNCGVGGFASDGITVVAAPEAQNAEQVCRDCERCRWQPDVDCGLAEHPHCQHCGHCEGRHGDWVSW
jgi:hypothetical protein